MNSIYWIILLLSSTSAKQFKAYWNIPTFFCKKFGFPILNVTEKFGIIQNEMDAFRGDKISILYDPGIFPALLHNSSSKEIFVRNGGVPQEGNLTEHIEMFIKNLDELMPDEKNTGLAIIDFESWRPVFRQNFGTLQPYKDVSIKLVREKHWLWPKKRVVEEATNLFEQYGRLFMETTLQVAKKLRPNARWGYYGLPYCFNGRGNNIEDCAANIKNENDGTQWLYDASDILYPSVYMSENLEYENRPKMIRGRIKESLRLSRKVNHNNKPPVLAYYRYVFTDSNQYLSEGDTLQSLNAMKSAGADGVVLWGSWHDLNTKQKCSTFYSYLDSILGPVVQSFEKSFKIEDAQ